MRHPLAAFFVSLLAIAALCGSASAGRGWCRSDPIVQIGNTSLQIWIAIPEADQPSVTGPINVVITVPVGTPHSVLLTDGGFNGYGEAITWIESGSMPTNGALPVVFAVSIPTVGGRLVPMNVEVIPAAGGAVYLGGETIGVTVTLNLSGETISDTSVVGASATGASVSGADGASAVGESAVGGSAVGASATGTTVAPEPTPDRSRPADRAHD